MSKSFWSQEEVTVEILRKRAHKEILELVCQHLATIKDNAAFDIALDAVLMYMTIDMGSTPRHVIKDAIHDRATALRLERQEAAK